MTDNNQLTIHEACVEQPSLSDFAGSSTLEIEFEFDEYGPTMNEPIPVEEWCKEWYQLRSAGFSPRTLQEESVGIGGRDLGDIRENEQSTPVDWCTDHNLHCTN